ncbi:MAG TPA: nitrogenase component 1 [Myxococcota bacterium]|nr:nitrogenase component 1 [Myxococcota bacterium]HQK52340.1 nitrogenase component 1 [Myxococcota bacterium]
MVEVDRSPPGGHPEDLSQRVTYTFLVGVYLATNALKDTVTLVEGPDCVHMKTQYVQGNHDWLSTLTSVSGHHRIANTALHPVQMTRSREDALRGTLARIASHPTTGGVLLTSMPMAAITGADYERICRDVQADTGRTVIHVPGRSLSGDWLDGYQETLVSLARQLDLSGSTPVPERVAVIGYLMDRHEGDHRANLREIRRLLTALGLDPVSIWLEGQRFQDLTRVREAGTLLAFPYGRKAARWIARRTGARVIECDLPFGLPATERLVQVLGKELGREQEAQTLIQAELSRIIPSLEFVIPFVFQHRRVGYVGDPVLVRGLRETLDLLGAELSFAVITHPRHHLAGLPEALGPATERLEWPRFKEMIAFLRDRVASRGIHLLVAHSGAVGLVTGHGLASLEFGFPSFHTHCLADRPFLGFGGVLFFIDAMANALRMAEVAQWTERLWGK